MTPTNDSPDSSRIFRYSLEEAKRVKLELEISGGNIVETFATMMSLKLWDDPTKVLWLIMEVQQRGLPKEKPAVIGICTNPLPDPLRVAKEGLESMMHMMKKRASDMMKTDAGRESLRREICAIQGRPIGSAFEGEEDGRCRNNAGEIIQV